MSFNIYFKHFSCSCYIFSVDDELRVLRNKIDQDYHDLSIRELCTPGTSGRCDVIFFKLNSMSNEMVSKMPALKGSQIFNNLWQKYGGSKRDSVVSMEMIFTIWSKICDKLQSKSQEFLDGEMQLQEVDKYIKMFDNDYKALEDEFIFLLKYFGGETTVLDYVKEKIWSVISKVKSYKKLFDCRQAAQAILELRKRFDLQGDFSKVEEIEQVRVLNYVVLTIKQVFHICLLIY